LGYVAANDPGTEVIETSFFGSPTEVADQLASQLYSLPEREDEVLVVFFRAELRALDGIARFTNTAGLFQMLPGLLVDFSGDGTVDIDDVDLLVSEIANFTGNLAFDLTADGLVNQDDLDRWLSDAAAASGFAEPYLKGDSNLDGTVNAVDLNNLALNWQESPGTWSGGDFSANGTVDTGDLNQLALNWNNSIAMAATAVPEPATVYLAICFLGLMILDRR
jgi:hypothetical protein